MPKPARLYAFAAIATGGLTIVGALVLWTCPSSTAFLTCLGLTLLGATFKVRLPGLTGTISASFVPLLFAIAGMSWQETAIMAVSAGIVQSVWGAKPCPTLLQIAFNGAALTISSTFAFGISRPFGSSGLWVRVCVAAMVFQMANVIAVSLILCLLNSSPLGGVWRNCHFWAFPYHLTGGVLASVWAQVPLTVGLSTVFLGAAMLYLMSTFYAEYVRRIGDSAIAP